MKIDRAGWPFVLGAAGPALGLALVLPWLAAAFALLALFMVYFFRDPDRAVPGQPDAVVSPADGRVLMAGEAEPASAPPGAWKQVSIFLSRSTCTSIASHRRARHPRGIHAGAVPRGVPARSRPG